MEQLFSLVTLVGMGLVLFLFLKWMVRAGQTHNKKNPLTPADLKLLEETAARLTADIRAAANECVARVEQACERAENLLRTIESVSIPAAEQSTHFASDMNQRIPSGEVELLRGLSGLARTQSRDASSAPRDYQVDSQVR